MQLRFCTLLSVIPSLLKSQAYDVMVPVDWSVNATVRRTVPEGGEPVKAATVQGQMRSRRLWLMSQRRKQ